MRPTTAIPHWVRLALVALGIPNLLTGAWAVFAPRSWFDDFPGWDPRLAAAEPPYNAHLVGDAGAGFLASAVAVLLAAWWAERRVAQLALLTYAAFTIPHAAYHALNPSDALTGAQDLQNAGALVVSAVITVGLLAVVSRTSPSSRPPSGFSDGPIGALPERP